MFPDDSIQKHKRDYIKKDRRKSATMLRAGNKALL